tara:strand:- start:2052 stop:2450 length:399 start_codon:yes stop_codon:yes gene_type:complete
MFNKRGETGEAVGLEETIFLILNLAFFAIVLVFIFNAGSKAFVYEESYAKQIVSIIDNAEPGMSVLINVGKGLEVGKDNGVTVFNVDNGKNLIEVKLSSNGYKYNYFSDYDVQLELQDNLLQIKIGGVVNEQ